MRDQRRHPPPPKHPDHVLIHNTTTTVKNWFDPPIALRKLKWQHPTAAYYLPVVLRKLNILQSFLPDLLHKININLHQSHGLHKQCRKRPYMKTLSLTVSRLFFLLQFQDSLFLLPVWLAWLKHQHNLTGVVTRMSQGPFFQSSWHYPRIHHNNLHHQERQLLHLNSSRSVSQGKIGGQKPKDTIWTILSEHLYYWCTSKCRSRSINWNFRILSCFQLRLDEIKNFLSMELQSLGEITSQHEDGCRVFNWGYGDHLSSLE